MPTLSQWPLSTDGIRFIAPEFMRSYLAKHPLTQDCYPVAQGYYPSALGHRMERHQHLDNLIIYCVAGAGSIEAEGLNTAIHAGDMVVLPKGTPHRYQADRNQPWTIYWLHFDGHLSEQFLRGVTHTTPKATLLPIGIQAKLIADFETMLEIRNTGYDPRNFIHISNLLRQLLSYLGALKLRTTTREGLYFDLDAVHALMQEKLHGQLELEELAQRVNLSKYHFSAKYKSITGQSPIQHFLHLKMEHACYLLDISGNSIKEISRSLGYEDSYYFSRLFKKIIGVAPRQYRQLNRG